MRKWKVERPSLAGGEIIDRRFVMRKICVVVLSRANYARIKSVLQTIKEHPKNDDIMDMKAYPVEGVAYFANSTKASHKNGNAKQCHMA